MTGLDPVSEFTEAVKRGQSIEQSKQGFAALAGLVAMYYEALDNTCLPKGLVLTLAQDYAMRLIMRCLLKGMEPPGNRATEGLY